MSGKNVKPVCRDCANMLMQERNGGRNNFYCMHPESRTETMPHRRIAQDRSKEIPMLTSPRWCPLKKAREELCK